MAAHWVSLVQAVQVLAVPQIGVDPPQSVLLAQPTHWPAMFPAVAHTGVAPVHGPVTAAPPSVEAPSAAAPASLVT
jgi:hypothetical protein